MVKRMVGAAQRSFEVSQHCIDPAKLAALGRLSAPARHMALAALVAAGATWWMESLIHFDPLEQSLEVVDAGPPPV